MDSIINTITEALATPAAPGWKERIFDYTLPVPKPEPLVSIGGEMLVSRENLAIITGAPKSCKSTFLASVAAACLCGGKILNIEASKPLKCLYCDTEQSVFHIAYQVDRVFRLAGMDKQMTDRFTVLSLRESSITERCEFLRDAVESLQPDIVFLDGAADLIADTNELEASEQLVAELLRLSSEFKCGIISVIHSVPSQTKVRGHLGSTAQRKAETVIMMKREGMSSEIEVSPLECRNRPFEKFVCFIGERGDLEFISQQERPHTAFDWVNFLMEPHKEYSNSELVALLAGKGFKKSAAQKGITTAMQKNLIAKHGDKYSVKLVEVTNEVTEGENDDDYEEEDL